MEAAVSLLDSLEDDDISEVKLISFWRNLIELVQLTAPTPRSPFKAHFAKIQWVRKNNWKIDDHREQGGKVHTMKGEEFT